MNRRKKDSETKSSRGLRSQEETEELVNKKNVRQAIPDL